MFIGQQGPLAGGYMFLRSKGIMVSELWNAINIAKTGFIDFER